MRACLLSGCARPAGRGDRPRDRAHGQVQGVPGHVSWTVASREASTYEGIDGEPCSFSLEALVDPLARTPRPGAADHPDLGALLRDRPEPGGVPARQPLHRGRHDCLFLDAPARDIADAFLSGATFRNGETADVVGAFGVPAGVRQASPGRSARPEAGAPSSSGRSPPVRCANGERCRRRRRPSSSSCARRASTKAARSPRRGVFRGAEPLRGHAPGESRRDAGDWVLRDGRSSSGSTGHGAPRQGLLARPASRGSAAHRLEVDGTPGGSWRRRDLEAELGAGSWARAGPGP